MSDSSQHPDSPESDAAPHEPATTTPEGSETSTTTTDSSKPKRETRSSWLWLLAGVIAAIVVPIVVQSVLAAPVEMTEEQRELSDSPDPNAEDSARLDAIKAEQAESRLRSTMINAGIAMGIVFGLFAGLIYKRLLMGVVGALVGVGVAFALAPLVTETILEFESDAIRDLNDVTAMIIHSLQWCTIGIAAAAAVLVGTLSIGKGAQALGLMLLAAVLGGVLYVVAGTAIDPATSVIPAAPVTGIARYLWTSVPPILAGFFLARTT